MAIDKLIVYDSRPDDYGETLIYPYRTGGLDKTASQLLPELVDYITSLGEPETDESRAVITALSAYDSFGPNKNGDGFYREDLIRDNDYGEKGGEPLVIPMFESFHHFARPYRHHINRPNSPAYGKVLRAFFNPSMDRVELVVSVDRKKAPDIADRIENYGDVSTSMGFRALYDVCNVCGNKARTRRDYCSHARNQMLKVLPDGRIVHVRNPYGRFFDISFVIDPADLTSRAVWVNRLPVSGEVKEASVSADTKYPILSRIDDGLVFLSSDLAKIAGCSPLDGDKEADITKEVSSEGEVVLTPNDEAYLREASDNLKTSEPSLSEDDLAFLIDNFSLEEIAATAGMCGISLKPEEAQYLALRSMGEPKLASDLRRARMIVWDEDAEPTDALVAGPEHFSEKLARTFLKDEDFMARRSYHRGWLAERLDKEGSLGRNPYIRQPVVVGPHLAHAPLDPREIRQGVSDMDKGTMRYLVGLLLGARWAIRRKQAAQIMRRNPELFAQIMGGPQAAPHDPRAYQGPEGLHGSFLMTAPVANYVRGIDTGAQIFPRAGLMEHMFHKEAELRAEARNVVGRMAGISSEKTALRYDTDSIGIYGHEFADRAIIIEAGR